MTKKNISLKIANLNNNIQYNPFEIDIKSPITPSKEEFNTMEHFYQEEDKLVISRSDLTKIIRNQFYNEINFKQSQDDILNQIDYFWHNKQVSKWLYQKIMGGVTRMIHDGKKPCPICLDE